MSTLASLILETYEKLRWLATHSAVIAHPQARSVVAELENLISQVESEAAALGHDSIAGPSQSFPLSRGIPPRRDPRETMRTVSEFYERVGQQRTQRRMAA
jgi:hypothetical protein